MNNANITPGFADFAHRHDAGISQLVWTTRPADLYTPVSAMLRLMDDNAPCFLLESVEGGETRGRYSVIGLMPDVMWKCHGDKAEICRSDDLSHANFTPCAEPSLVSFRNLLAESRIDIPEGLPPMAAGLVGYMAYDMVRQMEHLPPAKEDTLNVPDGCFIRPKVMVIFDSVADRMFIITSIWAEPQRGSAQSAYDAAQRRIQQVLDTLEKPLQHPFSTAPQQAELDFTSNTSRADYDQMLARAKEYILAGDIFQVVLSQRFSAPFPYPAFSLYRALRHLNPSPFLFYLNFAGFQLIGSSPEILVRLREGKVTIRPIAGTRKRGANKTEDRELAEDLLSDPKEIAEHLMLLDLGRNDVGRVARIGTVKTTQKMMIENYSHVMHIVSNVEGELNSAKYDAIDALVGGFPAGTVSGAPKVRAMEIINELEKHKRSFYAGCVGYFSANGDMDTCIALRTGLVKDGVLSVQAGGGIVADSDNEAEYQESLNKAKALMRAAAEAGKFV